MQYVYGFLVIIFGFFLVWKSDWLVNNFGRIAWAEEHLGTEGGTRIFYKLLGILIIIGSFLVMAGVFNNIIEGIFGASFRNTNETFAPVPRVEE